MNDLSVSQLVRNRYNTLGDVTSQYLWPRYDRHFVAIAWHNVWS